MEKRDSIWYPGDLSGREAAWVNSTNGPGDRQEAAGASLGVTPVCWRWGSAFGAYPEEDFRVSVPKLQVMPEPADPCKHDGVELRQYRAGGGRVYQPNPNTNTRVGAHGRQR